MVFKPYILKHGSTRTRPNPAEPTQTHPNLTFSALMQSRPPPPPVFLFLIMAGRSFLTRAPNHVPNQIRNVGSMVLYFFLLGSWHIINWNWCTFWLFRYFLPVYHLKVILKIVISMRAKLETCALNSRCFNYFQIRYTLNKEMKKSLPSEIGRYRQTRYTKISDPTPPPHWGPRIKPKRHKEICI